MLRDISDIYNRNIINILLICLVLVVPVTFFSYAAITYFNELETLEYRNIPAFCMWILNFSILFPPFFYIAKMDITEKEVNLIKILSVFINKFGFVAFLTIILFIIGMLGSVLLFIPSFLAIFMIILFPLFTDKENVLESLRSVWSVIKNEHIFIIVDVLILLSLNVLVWSGSFYLVANFENNTFVYIILRALTNSLLFPILYFYLTLKYRKDLV
ncbi:hypothetical protein ACFYKX_25215 [Cytobacillus sp. FJAT-54145]|uniref:Uncharacterized protein n=1 Tax=Cytobacillus spartinae TaxID=3299023 RepID=A0ABW6KI88_9BACI